MNLNFKKTFKMYIVKTISEKEICFTLSVAEFYYKSPLNLNSPIDTNYNLKIIH